MYEIIIDTVYKQNFNPWAWPKTCGARFWYVILAPLTHIQAITIPYPMRKTATDCEDPRDYEAFYPLTLFLSFIWIWFYTYCIVWWTYSITMAYELHFSILPMIIYPFGIALRDAKKLHDM